MSDPVPPAPSFRGLAKDSTEYRRVRAAYMKWWHRYAPKSSASREQTRISKALASRRGDATKQVKKAIIVQAMGGSCYDCGEDRMWLLTLHHRDPTIKEGMALWANSLTYKTWAEIWGCDLLCHHCHTLRHHPRNLTAGEVLRSVDKSRIERLQFKACSHPEPSPTDAVT